MPASSCDACGLVSSLYYSDDTNGRHLCKPCYLEGRPPMDPQEKALERAAEANQLAAAYMAVTATTDEQAIWCRDQAKLIATARKQLEAERDTMAQPAYRAYKAAREHFAPPIETLMAIEKHLLGQAQAHKHRREEETRAALAAATTTAEVAQAVQAIVPQIVQEREHWVAEVVDESAIPREFWILDTAKLNALARIQKGALAVPGVRAVNRPVAVNR